MKKTNLIATTFPGDAELKSQSLSLFPALSEVLRLFFIARVFLTIAGNPFSIASGDHVTNLCRTEDAGWQWFEPQAGRAVPLAGALDSGALDLQFCLV